MLSWLTRILQIIAGGLGSAVLNAITTLFGGLVSLLSGLFGNVKGAWAILADAGRLLEDAARAFGEAVWDRLDAVITHLIPRYAMTAWWWVTHPDRLAEVLAWWVVHWLERNAWTAARYLGEFTLALLRHELRRVADLAETVLAAIL